MYNIRSEYVLYKAVYIYCFKSVYVILKYHICITSELCMYYFRTLFVLLLDHICITSGPYNIRP